MQFMSAYLCADASAALQVRALKDYCNNYDLTSLNIKAGDVITVIVMIPTTNQFRTFENRSFKRFFTIMYYIHLKTVLNMLTI